MLETYKRTVTVILKYGVRRWSADEQYRPLFLLIFSSASATVTILVDDVNDNSPHFVQSVYRATMSENLGKAASVTSVLATDLDLGVNARLTYILAERDREHFYVSTIDATNTGVIKVFKVSYRGLCNTAIRNVITIIHHIKYLPTASSSRQNL